MANKTDSIVTDDSDASASDHNDRSSVSDEEIEEEDDDGYEISSATEDSNEVTTVIDKHKEPRSSSKPAKSKKCKTAEGSTADPQPESIAKAKKRKRKRRLRHFYNAIREQIEFYFSDSNLSKDRFLQQLIGKSSDSSKRLSYCTFRSVCFIFVIVLHRCSH